jgi:pyruvate/2-oxoacid:ferredoxin oxidoreductase beta subunit
MEREFVSYEIALALKELGFDEPCFAWYDGRYPSSINQDYCKNSEEWLNTIHCATPTFSQAFRWLYQKLDIEKGVMPLDTESQQLLLKELIDKVSSKHLLV